MVKRLFIIIGIFLITISSCKKEEVAVEVRFYDAKTDNNFYHVHFLNQKLGYVFGGKRWVKGVMAKTTDGGYSWSTVDSITADVLYSAHFFNEQEAIVCGFSGNIL